MTDLAQHCEPCDLPLATCVHGQPQADRLGGKVYDLMREGVTIEATQYGDCPGCTRRIQPGDKITYTDHGWAHDEHLAPEPNVFEGME